MNILIFANCHGASYKKFIEEHAKDSSTFIIDYIVSYENLDAYDKIKHKFEDADILIIQPVSSYPEFSMDSLSKILKPDCLVIRVPFVRFEGLWPKEKSRVLQKIAPAAVMDFPEKLDDASKIVEYLTENESNELDILENFRLAVEKMKEIEKSSDLTFVEFFLKHYKKVPFFRDALHPTSIMYDHLSREIVNLIGNKASIEFLPLPDIDLSQWKKEFGHYKPIKDKYARSLGLEYELSSYFSYNRYEYLRYIIDCENSNENTYISDLSMLKNLVLLKR